MIIWSSKKLEFALATGKIDAWGKVKYIIVPLIITTLGSGPIYIICPIYGKKAPTHYSLLSFVFSIASCFIIYWGVKKCFRENKKIDGAMFFERYTVLTLPILVRLIVFSIPASIILLIIFGWLTQTYLPNFADKTSIVLLTLGPIIMYVMYKMLSTSFRRLGELLNSETPEALYFAKNTPHLTHIKQIDFETKNSTKKTQQYMAPGAEDFSERIKRYSEQELRDSLLTIDREKYPENHKLLRKELGKRESKPEN